MKKLLILMVMAAGLTLAFLSNQNVKADESSQGQNIYDNKCAMCHGTNGKGEGPAAAAFNPKPFDLTTPALWKHDPRQRITNAIENGFGMMPQIDLSSAQIQAVIQYMEQTFQSGD